MKTKYIEGTNEQYSIREDGIVIQHYKFTWKGNITYIESFLKVHVKNHCVFLRKDSHNISFSINTLLLDYFNYKLCLKCSTKIYNKQEIYCSCCRREVIKVCNLRGRLKNLHNKPIYDKTMRYNLTKAYVASLLDMSVKELPEDLYQLYKANLKVKRLLSEKTGIPTNLIHKIL